MKPETTNKRSTFPPNQYTDVRIYRISSSFVFMKNLWTVNIFLSSSSVVHKKGHCDETQEIAAFCTFKVQQLFLALAKKTTFSCKTILVEIFNSHNAEIGHNSDKFSLLWIKLNSAFYITLGNLNTSSFAIKSIVFL